MTVASEITRLQNAKADARTSIINKGVDVPANAKLDTYHNYIDQILTGGGSQIGDFTALLDIRTSRLPFAGGSKVSPDIGACFTYIYNDYLFFTTNAISGNTSTLYYQGYFFVVKKGWTDYKMYNKQGDGNSDRSYNINSGIVVEGNILKLWRSYSTNRYAITGKVCRAEFDLTAEDRTGGGNSGDDTSLVKDQNMNLMTVEKGWSHAYSEEDPTLIFKQVLP